MVLEEIIKNLNLKYTWECFQSDILEINYIILRCFINEEKIIIREIYISSRLLKSGYEEKLLSYIKKEISELDNHPEVKTKLFNDEMKAIINDD